MSEENVIVTSEPAEAPKKTVRDLKKSVLKVGLYLMILFVLRYIAVYLIRAVQSALVDVVSPSALFIIRLSLSGMFLQILPSVIGAFMFGLIGKKNGKGVRDLYRVPKNCSRAVGNFPAVYGIMQCVNIVTLIVMFIISLHFDLGRKLNTVVTEASGTIGEALFMFFMLVVIAPVFEEFIFRGVIMEELRPYGNGFAIIATGLMFGIFHGNFQQCFYTAAAGIALGYIANVTGSIFPTMVIHAIMNSIGGVMILLMTTDGVQKFILRGSLGDIPDGDMIWVAMFGIFMVSVMIFIVVGIISAIMKIKKIKRYKVRKVCPEIPNGKKAAMLILTVPGILTLLMIADTFTGVFSNMIHSALGIS